MRDLFCQHVYLVENPNDDVWFDYLNNIDRFAFHYTRRIVIPDRPTEAFFHDFRMVARHELFEEATFWALLTRIEAYLLEHELYEALALNQRFKPVFSKILERDRQPGLVQ
ncbi:hypothetical protein [Rhabdobacter roseus]|nr:hypothetical protein [Rhabdobacter roseus]